MTVQASDSGRVIVDNVVDDLRTLAGRIASHTDEQGQEFLLRDIRNTKNIRAAIAALEKVEW